MKLDVDKLQEFLFEKIRSDSKDVVKEAAMKFKVTPQAIYKHINRLVKEGFIEKTGVGRGTVYRLRGDSIFQTFQLGSQLEEDVIWSQHFSKVVAEQPENIRDICHYVFTEMVNNAIEHSNGSSLEIMVMRDDERAIIVIQDDGEGIFKKIQRSFGLIHEEQALFELSKGKLTTDPSNHSGEGIFFSSRMMDGFFIFSGGKRFAHVSDVPLDILEPVEEALLKGTKILCGIELKTKRTVQGVFDEYAMPDEFDFSRTMIPMKLAEYDNEKLISRSQAKRVLARVDKFKYVEFNFENVDIVGQAFADEIFRVYASKNPEIDLKVVNANQDVMKMIQRARGKLSAQSKKDS